MLHILLFINTLFFCYILFTHGIVLLYLPYITYLFTKKYTPLQTYSNLSKYYGGKLIFNFLISICSSYSGTIRPSVDLYNKKECRCSILDKKSIRNPFNSIHAVALANLGELTSGLLMMEILKSENKKGIVAKIECKYYKKAKGKITATCKIDDFSGDYIVSNLIDSNKNLVCKITCYWDIKNK